MSGFLSPLQPRCFGRDPDALAWQLHLPESHGLRCRLWLLWCFRDALHLDFIRLAFGFYDSYHPSDLVLCLFLLHHRFYPPFRYSSPNSKQSLFNRMIKLQNFRGRIVLECTASFRCSGWLFVPVFIC